jgi:hypothetical protein
LRYNEPTEDSVFAAVTIVTSKNIDKKGAATNITRDSSTWNNEPGRAQAQLSLPNIGGHDDK